MPEKNATSLQSRWRLDAVALTLLAVGGLLTVAVASSRALSGGPNLLGSWGERAARWTVEPLGWGAAALVVGWFAVAGLLVVSRRPVHLGKRFLGWCALTAATA